MKANSIGRIAIRRYLETLALAGILFAQAARADDSHAYNDLIAQARSQITSHDFPIALQTAQQAILLDNANYVGHYYVAYALYKQGMFDGAGRAAQDSWDRAPTDRKEAIQKLIDAIAAGRVNSQTLTEAKEADEAGLLNKAATLYTKAWLANTNDQATALKAAHLWAEKLNNAQEAARILHAVLGNPHDEAITDDASKLLLTIQSQLQVVFHQSLDIGRRFLMERNYPEAAKALASAVEFFPDEIDPHIYLARARAGLNDFDGMKSELLAAVRTGMTNSDPILSRAEFYAQLSNPTFAALMQEVFGPSEEARIEETKKLWATLIQNESDYRLAKANFDAVAKNLNSYETSNLTSVERELQQAGELVFNGTLNAASEIFARAARLYNDATSRGKVNGERSDLQEQLRLLNGQVDDLQQSIDTKMDGFKTWSQDFLSSPDGQRIQLAAQNIAATPGNFQAAVDWGNREVNEARARKSHAINDEIANLKKQKELAENKISEVQRQLQNIGQDNN